MTTENPRTRARTPHCHICDRPGVRSDRYDAYACLSCDNWLEPVCMELTCEFCADRPPRPRACFPTRPRAGRWPAEPLDRCFLDLDSPSYPPTREEYAQCDCWRCRHAM